MEGCRAVLRLTAVSSRPPERAAFLQPACDLTAVSSRLPERAAFCSQRVTRAHPLTGSSGQQVRRADSMDEITGATRTLGRGPDTTRQWSSPLNPSREGRPDDAPRYPNTNPYGDRPYRPGQLADSAPSDPRHQPTVPGNTNTAWSFPDRRVKESTYLVLDPQTADRRRAEQYPTLREGWLPDELRGWRHPDQTMVYKRAPRTAGESLPDERPPSSPSLSASPGPPPKRIRLLPRVRRGPYARVRSPDRARRPVQVWTFPSPSSSDGVTWSNEPSPTRSSLQAPPSSPGPPTPHWVSEAQYEYKSPAPTSSSDSGS